MALSKLSGDAQGIVFVQLCNDPGIASNELRALTQALLQQLRADHEVAAALCRKVGLRSSKELREARRVQWWDKSLSSADLATLASLSSALPALESLNLAQESAFCPGGVQLLAEGLGAGALPAMTHLSIHGYMHVGDAGASALAAALGRGALPRLEYLTLHRAAIGDTGLVALAPALRRHPALEHLTLSHNPFGDEGLAALLAPPPLPAGALPSPAGVLTKLQRFSLDDTQVSDAGCAALTAALESGVLPALRYIGGLTSIPASAAAGAAVKEALDEHELTRVAAARDALARDAFIVVPVHLVPADTHQQLEFLMALQLAALIGTLVVLLLLLCLYSVFA